MKHVYVIEDDPCLRNLLRVFFDRQSGLQVHIAPEPLLCPLHPENALAAPPSCDVLIVDNQLPVMTGMEFVSRYGRSVRHKAVMSASFSSQDLAEAKKLGCRIFRKPFLLKELADWINSIKALEYSLAS